MAGKKGSARVEYVPLTLEDLSTSTMADPAEVAKLAPAKLSRVPQERTAQMLQFDRWCQELYEFWEAHGKPAPFTNAYPPRKVFVQPSQAPTVRFLARKSAQFLGYGISFGKDTPTQDGRMVVSFCVRDKQKREAKPETKPETGTLTEQ